MCRDFRHKQLDTKKDPFLRFTPSIKLVDMQIKHV